MSIGSRGQTRARRPTPTQKDKTKNRSQVVDNSPEKIIFLFFNDGQDGFRGHFLPSETLGDLNLDFEAVAPMRKILGIHKGLQVCEFQVFDSGIGTLEGNADLGGRQFSRP